MPLRPENSKLAIPLSDWASLTCALIWIYDEEVPSYGYHRSVIPDQESVAWLVRSGEAQVRTERKEWRIRPGEWFFLPEEKFWQDFAPETHILSIRFKASWITGVPLFHHREGLLLKAADYPQLEKTSLPLSRFYRRTFPEPGRHLRATMASPDQYLKLQYRVMVWLHAYAESLMAEGRVPSRISPMDPRVLTVARNLDNWPLHLPLDEEELAAQLNLSSRQLGRLFQNDFGKTPSRYFAERKIQNARSALEGHENSIKEIAYSLGFKSLSHFSTWFRKQSGISPREYRNDYDTYHKKR